LAHSWSGNLVTNGTWNDFWLNEGFTTYLQHRIMAQIHGPEFSEMVWSLEYTETMKELASLPARDQSLYLHLEGRNPDEAPSTVYGKGALLLRLLEETVGRQVWDDFLRNYFKRHQFKSISTAEFLAELKAALPGVGERVGIETWIHGPGIPANSPVPRSSAFERVEQAGRDWLSTGNITAINPSKWSSQERVHFIESLPRLSAERMAELDAHFRFRDSGNSEVRFVWLRKAAQEQYREAYPAIEDFLTIQGRRKFVRPVFSMLAQTPEGLAFARQVYQRVRPTYHSVSRSAIDAVLKWPEQ
jgi:leukotriene-A4 hydrolase